MLLRPLQSFAKPTARPSLVLRAQLTSAARFPTRQPSTTLAIAARKPIPLALQRYASTVPSGPTVGTVYDKIDKKAEEAIAHAKISTNRDVSEDSSVRHVFGEEGVEEEPKEQDMAAGIKADLVIGLPQIKTMCGPVFEERV